MDDYTLPVELERTEWTKVTDDAGNLVYEGFALDKNPCGSGTAFFPNGNRYKEGVWGYKGLVAGREYYPNGQLRFAGAYGLNHGYGPNFPRYGRFFNEEGELLYEGHFRISRSGLGWPFVEEPAEYGKVVQDAAPKLGVLGEVDMKSP